MARQEEITKVVSSRLVKFGRVKILFQTIVFAMILPMVFLVYVLQQIPHYLSGEHLADLTVNIEPSAYQAFPGELVKYVVAVENLGPSNARDVHVVTMLPEEIEYQNLELVDGLIVDQNALTWTIKHLLVYQTRQLTFTGIIDPSLLLEKELLIEAQIFSSAVDPIPENNVSSLVFAVSLPSSIEGVVWGDLNMNGIREMNEKLSDNFVVELYSGQQLISQTQTNDSGSYKFFNIYPGSYYLNFNTYRGVIFSPKDTTDEMHDSDPYPDTGVTEVITISSGQAEHSWDAGVSFNQHLPIIFNQYVSAPDLVINAIEIDYGTNIVEIEIKNVGNVAVEDAFWVDLYVNPVPPPTMTNQPCHIVLACQGTLVWGIDEDSLPLFPGDSMTIFTGDQFFTQTFSTFTGAFVDGMKVYVQVDSDNILTDYGNVLEAHEISGEPYNNILLKN